MIYLDSFLYYTVFASAVLIYGIGINKTVDIGITKFEDFSFYVKSVVVIALSSIASWLMTHYILVTVNLIELYPIVTFIVFACISSLAGEIISLKKNTSGSEFAVSFLITLLSVSESTSLLDTIVIFFSCIFTLVLLIPICITFKKRVSSDGRSLDENYYSFFFIFMAIILISMTVWDVVWFNLGAIK